MPEKFAGKSAEDIIKAYTELEKTLGQRSPSTVDYNKIGELIDNKLKDLRPPQVTDPTQEENMRQQKEIAKSLGLAFKEDVEQAKAQGYKEALLLNINTELEKKYSGKDGRPAYNTEAVKGFVQQNPWLREAHPEIVYKQMHEKALRDWDIAQALKGNRAPAVPKGGPKPPPGTPDTSKMTPDQKKAYIVSQIEAGAYE